jgi:predicted MFS family arabinose efflux permease
MPALPSAAKRRDFRLLWLAQTTSLIGDRLVTVALALYVIDLTGSATDLGIVLAASALPMVGLLLVGGVWADRLPRHRLMVTTDLIRFALHALLAVLIALGGPPIWTIAVIEALFGAAEAFFRPAVTGLVPQTVPEHELQEANALMQLVDNFSHFVGPALATALVVSVGFATAFAVDAATFLVSAALLVRLRPRRRAVAEPRPEERETVRESIRQGFHEVRSRQWVWVPLAGFCVAVFLCLSPSYVLGPVLAEDFYGSTSAYGLIAAALGIGTIGGSLAGIRWRPRHPMRLAVIGIVTWPPSELVFALGGPLVLVLVMSVIAGIGVALFEVWWQTALAERIPPDRLSRVASYDWTVSLGLLPIGYLLAGPAAEAWGSAEVLGAGSAIATLTLAALLLSPSVRHLTSRPLRTEVIEEPHAFPGP